MKHLCYVYIYKYRCLENVELVIDPRYEYTFCQDDNSLTISHSKQPLPTDFWGKNIYSLAAIFGNNGAGKTTAIRFILDFIVEGNNNPDVNGIIIYEENDKLYIWQNQQDNKHLNINTQISYEETNKLPRIECFFFTGHFSPEFSQDNLCTVEWTGLYNASDTYLLRQDLENFSNVSDSYLSISISSYLASHISQNNDRICRLLINKELRESLKDLDYRLPRFISIVPNRGGQDHLKLHRLAIAKREKIKDYLNPRPIKGLFPTREEILYRFIFFNLLNAYADDALQENDYQIIIDWNNINFIDGVLKCFDEFKEKYNNNKDKKAYTKLLVIYKVVSDIDKNCRYDENASSFYFDVNEDKDKIEDLLKTINQINIYLTSRFFDMNYSHEVNSTYCSLSSGEQAMLNLFSRLYDAIAVKPEKLNKTNNISFFIFDEAEIGFHPEWQRNYIDVILKFFEAIDKISEHKYQIIISSHSPLLQSDIPVSCCNYLKKESNLTRNDRNSIPQTFATNVFELYRNSFFLEEGLIGKFAEKKIRDLEKKIESDDNLDIDQIETKINLIGDERLRLYFYELLGRKDNMAVIKFYKEQIKRLEENKK